MRYLKRLLEFVQDHLLFAPTILTTIEVDVEELCTRTVTKMPIINPTTGLPRKGPWKMSPVALPAIRRNDDDRKSSEHTNR